MNLRTARRVLGWCLIINLGLLCVWFAMFAFGHDWMYAMQCKWFKITPEQFDFVQYAALGFCKILMFVFTFVPYFALRIVAARKPD